MRLAAVLVEAARAEALRVRVVHHDVRRDVPGEIAAALVAGFGVGEIRRVEVEARAAPASAGPHACLEATERRQHAAGHGVVEAEMRSEERRVGKEWRSRWSPDPEKKKQNTTNKS